jgi:hypothetical protein
MAPSEQVRGHVAANLHVGNDRAQLIDVLTQLLPFIRYPRALNALRVTMRSPIGSDRVRTCLSLRDQTLCEERLQQGREVRRCPHRRPPQRSSIRFPAAPISSGVLVRYQ